MLTLILSLIIAVIFIYLGIWINEKFYDYDGLACTSIIIGCISLIWFGIGVLSLININKRFEAFEYKYQNLVELVESYNNNSNFNGPDYGNMKDIVNAVYEANNTIAEHKAQWDSPWTGIWHSKEIGELKPIRLDKNIPKF